MKVIWLPLAKTQLRQKIVYCEINGQIEVSAFWDVRREPNELAAQLK